MNEVSRATIESEIEQYNFALSTIRAKIANAKAILSTSDARRGEFAHAAALGDPEAAKAMSAIRRQNENCQRDIDDLLLAIPDAERKIVEAQATLFQIKRDEATIRTVEIARERIDVAKKYDECMEGAERYYKRYVELGGDAYVSKTEQYELAGQAMRTNESEGLQGKLRILAAIPEYLRRLLVGVSFPNPMKLSLGESQYWSLPPDKDQADEKAA